MTNEERTAVVDAIEAMTSKVPFVRWLVGTGEWIAYQGMEPGDRWVTGATPDEALLALLMAITGVIGVSA